MKLKLKENPREWSKFATVMMVFCSGVSAVLWRQEVISREVFFGWVAGFGVVAWVAWLWPKPFRGFYRRGMTVTFHVGQVVGTVMLTVFYLVVMTPLGLALRLFGKDLLALKKQEGEKTYWKKARGGEHFERQF